VIKPRRTNGLPSRQEIIDFIAASPSPIGKREIAKAFKVRPADRVALKGLLKDIDRAGPIERGPRRRFAPAGLLPEIAVVELFAIDEGGEALCRLLGADPAETAPPLIRLADGKGELGLADRGVVRLRRLDDGSYAAAVIRKLSHKANGCSVSSRPGMMVAAR